MTKAFRDRDSSRRGAYIVIFGFNTDIRFGETVYHVQSEAREAEHLLETQVFVKGRCLGKAASSYAGLVERPEFSEERMHEMLKEQHRRFVDAARQGFVEDELAEQTAAFPAGGDGAQAAAAKPAPLAPEISMQPMAAEIGRGLTIECLPPAVAPDGSAVTLYVQVGEDGSPAAEAQLTCRLTSGSNAPAYLYAQCGPGGTAEVHLTLPSLDLSNTGMLVQANYRGKSVSRKFALKKT